MSREVLNGISNLGSALKRIENTATSMEGPDPRRRSTLTAFGDALEMSTGERNSQIMDLISNSKFKSWFSDTLAPTMTRNQAPVPGDPFPKYITRIVAPSVRAQDVINPNVVLTWALPSIQKQTARADAPTGLQLVRIFDGPEVLPKCAPVGNVFHIQKHNQHMLEFSHDLFQQTKTAAGVAPDNKGTFKVLDSMDDRKFVARFQPCGTRIGEDYEYNRNIYIDTKVVGDAMVDPIAFATDAAPQVGASVFLVNRLRVAGFQNEIRHAERLMCQAANAFDHDLPFKLTAAGPFTRFTNRLAVGRAIFGEAGIQDLYDAIHQADETKNAKSVVVSKNLPASRRPAQGVYLAMEPLVWNMGGFPPSNYLDFSEFGWFTSTHPFRVGLYSGSRSIFGLTHRAASRIGELIRNTGAGMRSKYVAYESSIVPDILPMATREQGQPATSDQQVMLLIR